MAGIQQEIAEALTSLLEFIEQSPWKEKYYFQIQKMISRLETPCVLAVAGRVKAGKSSFINALLGDDLAMVGTTETTATINYFRYGTPPDPRKPIRCVRDSDGSSTWESREFLDSLQGNSLEVLQRSRGIRHLEFYLENPKLKNICLVDTPGTNALVGDDGSAHEKVSREFFQMASELREKHAQETLTISSNADALIYITGPVADSGATEFLNDFQGVQSHVQSSNTLAVMAKIDMDDNLLPRRKDYAGHLEQVLSTHLNLPILVLPVSAGIQRVIDSRSEEELGRMREQLLAIFKTFDDLDFALSDESIFTQFTSEPLNRNMPWRVFVVIARELYCARSLEEALDTLRDIAGFRELLTALEEHFFRRGEFLRCFAVVRDVLDFLYALNQQEWYRYCENISRSVADAGEFIDFIMSHPNYSRNPTAEKLRRFIKDNLPADHSAELRQQIQEQISRFENLRDGVLYRNNRDFDGLQQLNRHRSVFSDEEFRELNILWGVYPEGRSALTREYCTRRLACWNTATLRSRSLEKKKIAAMVAKSYAELLNELSEKQS